MADAGRRYVALLRAVNVGGHGVVKQTVLKAEFEACGLTDVQTYIQSGNVVFTSSEMDADGLALKLERHLEASLGLRTIVFLFTHDQLQEAAAHNPLEPERLDTEWQCILTFLTDEPDAARREALMALQGEDYRFHVWEKVLYYSYPRVFVGRRRTVDFERVLGVKGTGRTWKVVGKLIEMAAPRD